jgi:hypothetical protein
MGLEIEEWWDQWDQPQDSSQGPLFQGNPPLRKLFLTAAHIFNSNSCALLEKNSGLGQLGVGRSEDLELRSLGEVSSQWQCRPIVVWLFLHPPCNPAQKE